jgi:hypothetical protein
VSTLRDPLAQLDPAEAVVPPDRLHYEIGMMLDKEDFQAEQTYHRGRLARALAYLHGSGTVAGLRVRVEPPLDPGDDPAFPEGREERLIVEPGVAIDRIGRLIEIPRPACIRLNRWFNDQEPDLLRQGFHAPSDGVVVDVFVRFSVCERGKTPAFPTGPFDVIDAVVAARLRDGYVLSLVIRAETDPPLPVPRWPDLTEIPDAADPAAELARRRELLREAILDAWAEGTARSDLGGLEPLPEHAAGQDTSDVFLARLVLPATDASPPVRDMTEAVQVLDEDRPLVLTTGALARWIGLV